MKFSILTASYNQLTWLKRCVRSVADQNYQNHEHLVQDAGSGPELEGWLANHSQAQLRVERDHGMYDGLNRGFARAGGEVCAWLNCDEQYLPGSLEKVAAVFEAEPSTDLVVGDFLLVDPRGQLVAFRRATPLRPAMILSDHLYDFTCAMFFRRRLVKEFPFRTDFRAAGDAEWVCRVLRSGARVTYLREYLATFAFTGENLSQRADCSLEAQKLREITPRWAQLARPALRAIRHLEKARAGGYRSGPLTYQIYAAEDDQSRTTFTCQHPNFRHPWGKV